MRDAKLRRLAAKGWRTGTAQQFLGLTDTEAVYIELRLKLSEGLRARRQQQRLTQHEVAKALRSSQSRIAKMESGDPSVSLDLLVRSLLRLGVSRRELARLIER